VRRAAARRVETAEGFEHVNLHGELLPTGFAHDRPEEIVLKGLVLGV
jgi:hypothetical protein